MVLSCHDHGWPQEVAALATKKLRLKDMHIALKSLKHIQDIILRACAVKSSQTGDDAIWIAAL